MSAAGRRRVLGQRAEDELDAVVAAMSPATPVVACWAYGALAPTELGLDVVDETICITTLRERVASTPIRRTTPTRPIPSTPSNTSSTSRPRKADRPP